MNDLTTSYFSIEKSDKQPDGTLMVYGKATDDSVDIDQQICDAGWLDRAMPAWFKSGGNIREQHSSIAAGVAKEYEPKADGHYIMAHIVDPVSVKKVDAGVLRGFSIGIKSPRVVRDTKAANGRIIDGQIVEVSLVDRPANPNCQLVLAKSVDGESSMVQVEELSEIEKHGTHNQKTHGGRGGAGGGAGSAGKLQEAVNGASSLTVKHGDVRMKDKAYAATKKADQAAEKIKNGDKAGAKEYMDAASDAVNELPEMAEKAGLSAAIVEQFSGFAEKARKAHTEFYKSDKSTNADVEKHGSHNQSSHGRRGSGGGAGGGAGAGGSKTKPNVVEDYKNNPVGSVTKEKIGQTKDNVKRIRERAAKTENVPPKAVDKLRDAESHLENAKNSKTIREASSKLKDAETSLLSARDQLEDQNYHALATGVHEEWNSVTRIDIRMRLGQTKATDAELRKALQSALQLHSLNKSEETSMKDTLVELPVEVVADLLKFDAAQYEAARNALASLIEVEAGEMRDGHNEIQSISHLLQSVMHLHAWYEGEEAEGEVVEKEEMIEEDKYMAAEAKEEEAEKSAEVSKCLECGCNQPGQSHGSADVTTAEMYSPDETPKSAEGEEPAVAAEEEVKAEEPATEETPAVETTEVSADDKPADVEALVEQVVKSATESLKSEIADLVSAKEAALNKAMSLETELELAKSLAVAGGPSRTAKPINVKTTNDLLTKAAIYKAKANATTDPTLAKGYKTLAEEFLSKASEADNK